jgi:hypothetical protein
MAKEKNLSPKSLTQQEKLEIVLRKNTFFFLNKASEEKWEAHISSITNLLLILQRRLETAKSEKTKKKIVIDTVFKKADGLSAVLALAAISEEFLLRLITFARTINDKYLNEIFNKDSFSHISADNECSKANLRKLIASKREVAESIVNLIFEGFSIPILQENLPLFELKKLNFSKLDFSTESLIDSIVRHSKSGHYKAQGDNVPSGLIRAG